MWEVGEVRGVRCMIMMANQQKDQRNTTSPPHNRTNSDVMQPLNSWRCPVVLTRPRRRPPSPPYSPSIVQVLGCINAGRPPKRSAPSGSDGSASIISGRGSNSPTPNPQLTAICTTAGLLKVRGTSTLGRTNIPNRSWWCPWVVGGVGVGMGVCGCRCGSGCMCLWRWRWTCAALLVRPRVEVPVPHPYPDPHITPLTSTPSPTPLASHELQQPDVRSPRFAQIRYDNFDIIVDRFLSRAFPTHFPRISQLYTTPDAPV